MAFSAIKPCSRVMRALPHQSDEQQEDVYNMLLKEAAEERKREGKEEEDDDDEEEEESPHRKSFNCEDPLIKISSHDPSNASPKDLPTFIAPQGLHSLHLPHRKDRRKGEGHLHFTKSDRNSRHLVPLCEDKVFTLNPSKKTSSGVYSLLQPMPSKQHAHAHPHTYKQSSGTNLGIYGPALERERTISVYDMGEGKKRCSSASSGDMGSSEKAVMVKNRICDVQSSSWEEEVRHAMAKNSLSKRQSEEGCKRASVGCGLPSSLSVQDFGISSLPPTLIVKRPTSRGNVDAAICTEESGAKLMHDTAVGGCALHHKLGAAEEKRMWKGFNVVKSPSEERWEEAAQDEERQEMQRRARSQSMRYDTNVRTSELARIHRSEAIVCNNALYNDDEWAVYTRSGCINVRPRRSVDGRDMMAPCCRSLLGRSLSMRDTRTGLIMECAACGTALNGSEGRILCFCSCCAAAQDLTQVRTPRSHKKKGGSGFLRACRRLLGLSKKCLTKP